MCSLGVSHGHVGASLGDVDSEHITTLCGLGKYLSLGWLSEKWEWSTLYS